MSIETEHQDPEFRRKITVYFQNFMFRHRSQAREYKINGLLIENGSRGWRNVAKHQLLSAVMTETISELLMMPSEKIKLLTNLSLTHDVDKRRQHERLSQEQVITEEGNKKERPLIAPSTNFTDFATWSVDEYVLRYVDSSVGENPKQKYAGHWYGTRNPNNLPEVIILPWRQRVKMFKENKIEEGKNGIPIYGMTTWEKLEEIMTTIENNLYNSIINQNPDLANKYYCPSQLTEIVEDKIHEKILKQ